MAANMTMMRLDFSYQSRKVLRCCEKEAQGTAGACRLRCFLRLGGKTDYSQLSIVALRNCLLLRRSWTLPDPVLPR